MNLIVLGPPGSGKGTQAALLAKHFCLTHISSGALLRQEALKNTPKGQLIRDIQSSGKLVPFDTVLELIQPLLLTPGGFVLDGTPRDIAQAQHLDWFFSENLIALDKAILLDLPDADALTRLLKRSQQQGRSDDTQETINLRLQIYHQATQPVIDLYQKQNKLLRIDARPDIDTIFQDILAHLG